MTSIEEAARQAEGEALPGAADRAANIRRNGSRLQRVARFVHKWAGLVAAIWLFILGSTGFFLNNSDWRWLQRVTAPSWLTTPRLEQMAAANVARIWAIDPANSADRIAAGPRGMWSSNDGGRHWEATRLGGGEPLQIFAVEADPNLGWDRLWIGTDDGLYVSTDHGATAQPVALRGTRVSSLAAGATDDELLGVIDKSSVFRLSTADPQSMHRIDLAPLEAAARPTEMRLHKYLRAVHFGRGLLDAATSRLINEAGGLALAILALTGLAYWALPKYWTARIRAGKSGPSGEAKRQALLWLYRSHGATVGLVGFPVILYLAVTGIFVGHDRELGDWLRSIRVSDSYFTPAFRLSSWNGTIDALVGYPGVPHSFSVGNNLGMFTTVDDGRSWTRATTDAGRAVPGASRMRRLGDAVVVMTGLSGATLIRSKDGRSVEANIGAQTPRMTSHSSGAPAFGEQRHAMAMRAAPQDVARVDDRLYWKAGDRFVITDLAGKTLDSFDADPPRSGGAPLVMWLRQLHAGVLIWSEWRWINDFFAVCAIALTVSGLARWLRRKWG